MNLRVGILGSGFMGTAHAACYDRLGVDVAMVASASGRARVSEGFTETTRWTTDIQEVISDDKVDCVDITLPNHLHKEAALACVRAGKPFLMEKPLARTVAEAQEIVQAVSDAGLVAVYGENVRFKPSAVKTKAMIDQGALGNVLMLRANEIHSGPAHSEWFWDGTLAGGGALIDMGIHGIFALEWLSGSKIKKVYAEAGVLKWADRCRGGSEDTALVVLRFDNGALAELAVSWAIAGGIDVRLEVFGTAGTVYLNGSRGIGGLTVYSERGYGPGLAVESTERPHVSDSKGWSWPAPDEWAEHGHLQEVEHFLRCVSGVEQPRCTVQDGLRALQVVDAVYRSVETGQAVLV